MGIRPQRLGGGAQVVRRPALGWVTPDHDADLLVLALARRESRWLPVVGGLALRSRRPFSLTGRRTVTVVLICAWCGIRDYPARRQTGSSSLRLLSMYICTCAASTAPSRCDRRYRANRRGRENPGRLGL